MPFLDHLHCVANGVSLSGQDAQLAMDEILTGAASVPQIAAFLVALRMKGETSAELLGFARSMRSKAVSIDPGPGPLVDTCGTGGDACGTFNISTAAAIVAAGAGVKVAKHGNRSISSRCGSADIFEALGVPVVLSPEQSAHCLRETGIGFLFAPAFHPAMKFAQPARLELKLRTVFNLLGPLANPAGAPAQLIGAPSAPAARLMAEALAQLGTSRSFVVHGHDGLDEITTTTETLALEIAGGTVTEHTLSPEQFGVPRATLADLSGGDPATGAAIVRAILDGEPGPRRDIVLVNTAAALVAAGVASDFKDGVDRAAQSIDSGAASGKLARLAATASSF